MSLVAYLACCRPMKSNTSNRRDMMTSLIELCSPWTHAYLIQVRFYPSQDKTIMTTMTAQAICWSIDPTLKDSNRCNNRAAVRDLALITAVITNVIISSGSLMTEQTKEQLSIATTTMKVTRMNSKGLCPSTEEFVTFWRRIRRKGYSTLNLWTSS